jgi:hypothetical protein
MHVQLRISNYTVSQLNKGVFGLDVNKGMSSSHLIFSWMYYLVGWMNEDERDENYYLIIFQIIINNTLINIC